MGGNAFNRKGIKARRFNIEDMNRTYDKISNILKPFKHDIIPYYREKQDFGDIDILVMKPDGGDIRCVTEQVAKTLNSPEKPFYNSNMHSIISDDFIQVDLIWTKEKWYDSSIHYFSWNDIGNFLGRIAHSLGFKLGFHGLSLPIRYDTYELCDIELTNDFKEIFKYFSWDYERFSKGFNTKEEIFEFVTKQNYFQGCKYKFEELNHINRVRNRKRSMYNEFIEYLTKNNLIETTIELQPKFSYQLDAINKFNKMDIYDNAIQKYNEAKIIKQYFNGDIISNITGYVNIDLGNFIKFVKLDNDWKSIALSENESKVKTYILEKMKLFECKNI